MALAQTCLPVSVLQPVSLCYSWLFLGSESAVTAEADCSTTAKLAIPEQPKMQSEKFFFLISDVFPL